jgi:hypothetical protein
MCQFYQRFAACKRAQCLPELNLLTEAALDLVNG